MILLGVSDLEVDADGVSVAAFARLTPSCPLELRCRTVVAITGLDSGSFASRKPVFFAFFVGREDDDGEVLSGEAFFFIAVRESSAGGT